MVPWSQLRQPFLGWLRTDLTTEFTHFNLVIHLSKVQQTALSLSAFSTSRRPCCLCDTFDRPFLPEWCRSEQSETSFSRCSPQLLQGKLTWSMTRQQACPFPAGVVTLVSGGVEHFVHLIRRNLCHCAVTWPRSRLGVTHDFLGLNWAPLNLCCFFCSSTSPPFGPLFHAFFPP